MTITWNQVCDLAFKAGAKYPELVGAQFAIESDWGKSPSGRNNYFGLKGVEGQGDALDTVEEVEGEDQVQKHIFIDFDSLEECVKYLVDRWYKDFKTYKGVNNAPTIEAAADELRKQGYATDSEYADSLKRILKQVVAKPAPAKPVVKHKAPLFTITATQATFLKKEEKQASELADNQKAEVEIGKTYGVMEIREQPRSAHAEVVLAHGSGTWLIFLPHWKITQKDLPYSGAIAPSEIDWSNFDQKITKNFTVGEVLQWDHRRRPAAGSAAPGRILQAAGQLQRIRDHWGKPIGVTSWYRPEPINQEVGGVRGSQHTLGTAFDIYSWNGDMDAFYKWLIVRWSGGFGDGRHKGFIHLDLRGNGVFMPGGGATNYTWWTY